MTTNNLEAFNSFERLLKGKIVVADTSSLLMAGTTLLTRISECEMVVPAIVVQELEGKRSHPTVGFLAREWIRLLEDLRVKNGVELRKGVQIDNNITIRVEPNHTKQECLPKHLRDGTNDSTILAVAKNLDTEDARPVIVLSNDTPMRLHATLDLELEAAEFSSMDNETPFTARLTVEVSDNEYAKETPYNRRKFKKLVEEKILEKPAKIFIVDVVLESDPETVLHTILVDGDDVVPVRRKEKASGITGKTVEQDIALNLLKNPDIPIVSISGGAGTGKTILTVATAMEAVKDNQNYAYSKIVVFRSLHEMGIGQDVGFLPGDLGAKMEPWAGAISDALDVIAAKKKPLKNNDPRVAFEKRDAEVEKMMEMIEVSPITYLRGRSLSNSFIILDEAQNFSRTELLNIISRVGEDSKIVLLWDDAQIDNRFLQPGNKADIWSVVKSFRNEDLFAHTTLLRTERSRVAELAAKVLEKDH